MVASDWMVGKPYEGPIDVGGYMLIPKGLEKWRRNMSSLRRVHNVSIASACRRRSEKSR